MSEISKKAKKYIRLILIAGVMFLLGSFIAGNFQFKEWDQFMKAILVVVFLIWILIDDM
jgi:glucose uptake protein GlcU